MSWLKCLTELTNHRHTNNTDANCFLSFFHQSAFVKSLICDLEPLTLHRTDPSCRSDPTFSRSREGKVTCEEPAFGVVDGSVLSPSEAGKRRFEQLRFRDRTLQTRVQGGPRGVHNRTRSVLAPRWFCSAEAKRTLSTTPEQKREIVSSCCATVARRWSGPVRSGPRGGPIWTSGPPSRCAQQLTVLGCCLHTKSDRKSNSF